MVDQIGSRFRLDRSSGLGYLRPGLATVGQVPEISRPGQRRSRVMPKASPFDPKNEKRLS